MQAFSCQSVHLNLTAKKKKTVVIIKEMIFLFDIHFNPILFADTLQYLKRNLLCNYSTS